MEAETEEEDLHICGKCRFEFNSLNSFMKHKNTCSPKPRAKTSADVPFSSSSSSSSSSAHASAVVDDAAAALAAAAALSDISAEGLVEEEVEMQMDPVDEQMAEETVETADDGHGEEDEEEDEPDGDGESLVAKVIGEEVRLAKEEVLFDGDQNRGSSSHGIQVFDLPPPTGDEDQTMSVFSLDAEGNMVELPLKYPSEVRKPAITVEPHVSESILDSSAFMPVTLGEVVAAPSSTNAGEAEEESSGMVPSLDVPVRLGPKIFPCSYDGCNYVTKYAKDLQRHLLVHTGEKPFVCGECKKAFNRIDKLKIHQRIHSGFKPFRCQFCDYACSERSAMKKHMRTHSDDRPFKCMICPYASRNSSQLVVHLRTHTGDAPFQCHICCSKFKVNSDLKRHMRTHTGEKPFKCPHCEYRCSVKSNLKPHVQMNHEPTEVQKCLVPDCGFETNTKGEFKAHQRTHSDYKQTIRPVTLNCQLCNYKCLNKTNLAMHMQTDHSAEGKKTIQEVLENGPFICTFCSFTAKFQSNLRKHVRKNHPEALVTSRVKKEELGAVNNNNAATPGGNNENNTKKNLAAAVLAAALRIKKGSIKQQQKAARTAAAAANATSASSSSLDKKPFQCLYCDKAFSRHDALETHCKNRHQDQRFTVVSAEAFVQHQLQQQQPQQHDSAQTAVLEHSQIHETHHRLQPVVGVPHTEETTTTTTTIQTESGQLINVAVINSDKMTTLDHRATGGQANSGSIILQPLTSGEVPNLKSVQILTTPHHHAINQDPNVFDSIIQHHNPAEVTSHQQQQQTHFGPSNLMAVSGPAGHITLQPMTQAIPTTSGGAATATHHLMEPAEPTSLPVIQSADGQTHYLIIQPH